MPELLALVQQRRSVRAYQQRPLDQAQLDAILGCLQAAPSAGNLQAYRLVLVQDPQQRAAVARAALNQPQVAQAAALLVFFQDSARSAAKYGQRGAELYALQDATIACAYAQLAANDQGLGSCWVGAFYPNQLRQALAAPASLEPVAILTLGYPSEAPAPQPRRPLTELVRYETF